MLERCERTGGRTTVPVACHDCAGAMDEDWNDLRIFLTLVRTGTLAKAGGALGIDPSTVYRRIGKLEAQLGAKLFARRGRGYRLTPAGDELADKATRVEEAIVEARRSVAGGDDAVRGTLRITTNESLMERWLAPHLAAFQQAHPELVVEVVVHLRLFHLGRGEADVALRPGPKPDEDDVVAKLLVRGAGAFYASAAYLERAGRPATRAELADMDAVGLDDSLAHTVFARATERCFPPSNVRFRCSSLSTQATLVEAGAGIAPLPCYMMDPRPGVVRLFDPEEDLQMPLWLLFHHDLRGAGRVRAFVDFVEARVTEDRHRFEGHERVVR